MVNWPPHPLRALPLLTAYATMIDDLGEVAQLTAEFISSLDNLPQEVQHIVKEIEHKDAKVQGKRILLVQRAL